MTQRPDFIDNRDGNTLASAISRYIHFLKRKLAEPPSISIAAAYFSPAGYKSIADALDSVGGVRLLLGVEPEKKDREQWREPGQPRGDSYKAHLVDEALRRLHEDLRRDRDLLGFSRDVDSNLQRLIDFLRRPDVEVRLYKDTFLHGKAYMFSPEEGVIAGSSNFTGAGLNSNMELNLARYDPHVLGLVWNWYNDLWTQAEHYDLAQIYEARFEPYSPYLIYLRVLWERYGSEIQEETEETPTGTVELTTFQNDGIFRAKRFLGTYNGVIVADGVGLGKTFIAGELIREAVQERRQRALVIAPAYLRDGMWAKFQSRLNVHFEIVSYAEIRDELQLGGQIPRFVRNKEEYQLVVIDEAHAFRNPSTNQAEALRLLLQEDPPKDLVLLTATPVNNSLWDLYYLLSYFIKNDAMFSAYGIPSLRERFKEAQAEDPNNLSPTSLFDILDRTTVRRTRHFVKEYYPNATIRKDGEEIPIRFPDVVPFKVEYEFDEVIDDDFFSDISAGLAAGENEEPTLTLALYRPSLYKDGNDGSELALIGLLRVGILKRLESSTRAFSNTIGRMIERYEAAVALLRRGVFPATEYVDEWTESDSDEAFEELFKAEDTISLDGVDTARLENDLVADIEILQRWKVRADSVGSDNDAKLERLNEILKDIVKRAKADAVRDGEFRRNRKVLLFSYFEDTVDLILEYLLQAVSKDDILKCYDGRIAGVSGAEAKMGITRDRAVMGFAPESTEAPKGIKDEFDILVTTDVLGQGVNLQDCRNVINFDLPWNPMRVVQRNGRIDRIASPHRRVFTYVFFPEDRLDELLVLEYRVMRKLAQAAKTIGLENEVFPDVEKIEQNFADRREDIERLRQEDPTLLEEGGTESAAYTGEEYRQELRKGLKDYRNQIETLPWAAGSGFLGDRSGHFFCAKIGDGCFLRFVTRTTDDVISDTLTCLRLIQCAERTERVLTREMKEAIYAAWQVAREDIYKDWQRQTDPKNIVPEVRPLFRRVAEHIRQYPPVSLTQEELENLLDSVEAPWGRRYENELREIYRQDINPLEKTRMLVEKVRELGLQPFSPPEPLPPIEADEIKLICWMAIERPTD